MSAAARGRTLAERAGTEVDRAGRVHVNPDLTLPGHPEVFVVGDLMALDNLPGVAQVAIQGGRYAAGTIRARIDGKAEPLRHLNHADLPGSPSALTSTSTVITWAANERLQDLTQQRQ